MMVYVRKPNELLCDLDDTKSVSVFQDMALHMGLISGKCSVRFYRVYKSNHHWHGVALLSGDISDLQATTLQRNMGDDTKRATYNLMRCKLGDPAPIVLFAKVPYHRAADFTCNCKSMPCRHTKKLRWLGTWASLTHLVGRYNEKFNAN